METDRWSFARTRLLLSHLLPCVGLTGSAAGTMRWCSLVVAVGVLSVANGFAFKPMRPKAMKGTR
eukprot:3561522-Prorocentrum_lima.AAC.1